MSEASGPPPLPLPLPLTERIGEEMARLRRVRQVSLQLRAKAALARAQARARRMTHQVRQRAATVRLLLAPPAEVPGEQRPGHPWQSRRSRGWRAGAANAAATTPATARARAGDLAYFWAWAELELELPRHYPAPASAVSRFIADHLQGLRPQTEAALLARYRQKLPGGKARPGPHSLATIERRLTSLSLAHQQAGVPDPCAQPAVRWLLARAGRTLRRGSVRRKRSAAGEVLDAMVATCDEGLAGRRDRALLLFADAAGGRRRSEVAAARVEDLIAETGGYLVHLRHAAAGSSFRTRDVEIHGRAAAALRGWIEAAGLTVGPLFRSLDRWSHLGGGLSDRGVAEIVKRRAALAGYDPAQFGGRSLGPARA